MIDYAHALNSAQYEAATCGDGPVLVVAGAGSGKTRTITYRLSWLADHGVPPESMLLLTFTRKAAQEMLQRAAALSDHALSLVQGGTFHSFAFGVLRRYRPDWLEDRPFTVMDSADINAAVKACKDDLRLGKGDRSFPRTQAIVGFLSKARNKEMRLDEVLQREAFHLLPYAEPLMQLGEAYDAYRKEKGLLDYDDLLFELEHLLRTNERAAENLRRRYTHILVDEYQDTNLVQARIVRLLAGPEGEGMPPGNVMAVGDDAQSIYAFRGADVRNILDFPKLFPGTRVIRLEENYRSTQPVLDVANAVLAPACKDAALVLLCVPAAVFADVAASVCAHLPATAILADITSVKVRPLQQMEAIWPGPVVGTHPLFGPATPDEDGLPVTVTPGRTAREEDTALVEAFFRALGCSTFRATADEHDRAMARVQNMNFITNLAYFALLAGQEDLLPYITPSFRRRLHAAEKMLTEDGTMFTGLFEANPYSHEAVRQYRKMLNVAAAGDIELLCRRAQWWWKK